MTAYKLASWQQAYIARYRGLYAITTPRLFHSAESATLNTEQLIEGGAGLIQFRDKHSDHATRFEVAKALADVCASNHIPLIINDDVKLALAVDADGVHVGQTDTSCRQARAQLGRDKIIGVTCHGSAELAHDAELSGADYIALGACFASQSKPNAPVLSPDALATITQSVSVPVVAIGGIHETNIHHVLQAGIPIVAMIEALYSTDNLAENVRRITSKFV